MVSALTLLRSDDSATAAENWSYLLLADEIRRTSADPIADLRELFARMCFNAIVSTGRASRLLRPGSPRLKPKVRTAVRDCVPCTVDSDTAISSLTDPLIQCAHFAI